MSLNTTKPLKVFVVEDETMYNRMVSYVFKLNPDHEVHSFKTGQECLENLHLNPDIISLDYSLPDMTGAEILEKITAFNNAIKVIVLSGQTEIQVALNLLKKGAYEYIVKDDDTKEKLLNAVERIKENLSLKNEVDSLKTELADKFTFSKTIIGDSPAINKVFNLMQKCIKTNISVSITGETGTGKEVAAKAIHYNSARRKNKFVAVNLAAIPSELMESELFGHEKGAFTGAASKRLGYLEVADKGTLFLDEIAEVDMNVQVKLLRALQEREFIRVGGKSPIKFDARIIVATHKNLAEEVNEGRFREDLYYRLLGMTIELPPLRDRDKDIILLADYFLKEFCKSNGLGKVNLAKNAKDKLMIYPYPGNIRELKATIELAAVMANDGVIQAEDISFKSPKKGSNFLLEEMTLKAYNNLIVHHYLEKYSNNIMKVAEKLDIGKSTIYRMLQEEKEKSLVN